jgi:hypothetical protein
MLLHFNLYLPSLWLAGVRLMTPDAGGGAAGAAGVHLGQLPKWLTAAGRAVQLSCAVE